MARPSHWSERADIGYLIACLLGNYVIVGTEGLAPSSRNLFQNNQDYFMLFLTGLDHRRQPAVRGSGTPQRYILWHWKPPICEYYFESNIVTRKEI
jgi:hypothetical protein